MGVKICFQNAEEIGVSCSRHSEHLEGPELVQPLTHRSARVPGHGEGLGLQAPV
jgi:hypothetical protein